MPSATSASVTRENTPVDGAMDLGPGLGKRKRDTSGESTGSAPETEEVEQPPKRKRGRPRKNPEVTADGAAAVPVITGVVRAELLKPASHPRPARQLFVFGNGDMGQFGLGTEVVSSLISSSHLQ